MPAPLNPPSTNPQTPQQVAANLETLYSAPASISKFGAYFFMQNVAFTDFLEEVAFAIAFGAGQVAVNTYSQYAGASNVQLFIEDYSALNTNAPKIFTGPSQNYQVFISMDRTSSNNAVGQIQLPYQIAKVLSSTFTYGLVTRLILDRYQTAWGNAGFKLSYPLQLVAAPPRVTTNPASPTKIPLNAADWCQNYLQQLSASLTNPTTWTNASAAASAANGNADYVGCLSMLTNSSLQAVGIVMGWLAGDALTDPTNASGQSYQSAFFTILNSNYTTIQIGMMVGYVFSYLSGFLSSERSQAAIAGNIDPGVLTDPVKAPPEIYSYLSFNALSAAQTNAPTLANQFFLFIVQEFYAIAADATKAQQYQGFIQGFEQGLLLGADVMYQQLYTEAYQLGYTNGFRDGYAQGYSAGWTAGYGAGYQNGLNNWISGLSNVFSGLSTTLGSANTILSDATYVVSVVSSIF